MKHKQFDKVYPYSYFLVRKSDGMKYVGIRYANVKKNLTPSEDFGKVYFTSGRLRKEFKNNPENFEYRLCYTFDNIEEMFEWEKNVVLKVYKRHDWANQGWGPNFGENPLIGNLIREGLYKKDSCGKTAKEKQTEKFVDWVWNTEEGVNWRVNISKRISNMLDNFSEEKKAEIQQKRKQSMDFKAASVKAQKTMREVGADGLTGLQRKARKSHQKLKESGKASELGKERDAKYTKKLGEMSEEEFELWCEGRSPRTINGAISRRNKYLKQIGAD